MDADAAHEFEKVAKAGENSCITCSGGGGVCSF